MPHIQTSRRRARPSRARRSALAIGALSLALVASGCSAQFDRPQPVAGGQQVVVDPGTGQYVDPGTGEVVDPGTVAPGTGGVPVAQPSGSSATLGPAPGSSRAPGVRPGPGASTRPGTPPQQTTVDPGRKTGITATTIKLAYLIPKTGAAPLPPQVEQGINAYWGYVRNTVKGVFGRNVQVTVYDTQSSEQVAEQQAQRAIEDGNFAVVALDRLGVQKKIGEYLDKRQVPNVMIQTPVNLAASQSWTFGVTIDHGYQGTMIADYLRRGLALKTVAVVYETDSTLKPGVEAFKAEARKVGLNVVYEKTIDPGGDTFQVATELSQKKADATWLYMAPDTAAKVISPSEQAGYHPHWFANSISWNFDLIFPLTSTTGMQKAHAFSPWPSLDDKRTATYQASYRQQYSAPPIDLGIPGWGVGQIVSSALKLAGKDLGQNGFRHALQNLRLTDKGLLDGTPLLWAPISFGPGVRQGGNSVATYKCVCNGASGRWTTESAFRSSY